MKMFEHSNGNNLTATKNYKKTDAQIRSETSQVVLLGSPNQMAGTSGSTSAANKPSKVVRHDF